MNPGAAKSAAMIPCRSIILIVLSLMTYVKKHEGVWFATMEQIARRVLECAGIKSLASVSYGSPTMAMK
jgi:hypothetical protein